MHLTDRQNWGLSAVVGALIAANGAVWVVQWNGTFGRITGGFLGLAGLFIAVNAIRATRDTRRAGSMDWSRRKTLFNVIASLALAINLVWSLTPLL